MSDNEKIVALFRRLGMKFYELQTGFGAMFMLLADDGRKIFTLNEFLKMKDHVEKSPEMTKLRAFLDTLANPTEPVDFEKLLREFEGPVQ